MQAPMHVEELPELESGSAVWYRPHILLARSPLEHSERSVRAYYQMLATHLAGAVGPYVFVSDTRHIRSIPDSRARRLHAELGPDVIRRSPGTCVQSVVIVRGPLMRALLRSVLWVMGDRATPTAVVTSLVDALDVARRAL